MTEEAVIKSKRRSGGRQARVAMRAAPLTDDIKPVRPGMVSNRYQPLSQSDVASVHASALQVLEEIGLADAPESGIAAMTAAGAILGEDGRLRFPPRLVEDMLQKAARDITLCARNSKQDLQLSQNRVHYGTAGAAVHLVNPVTREYEESKLIHLYQAALLAEQLDNIHFFQRPMVARDVLDNRELDINTLYACLSGTTKHVGTSFVAPDHVPDALDLLHRVAGSEEKWRERPFVSNSNCFVIPPLKFATEACQIMENCIAGGMPVLLLSAGQAGATAPASIIGAVVQAVAECLAGVIYINSIKPGHPAIFGTWPFVSDLRTGAMSGGSGEQALLTAACAQMGNYYGLPCGAAAGMADAKLPDNQAGYEKAISNVMAGLTGLNMVYESVGMHASLLGFCLESMIIDNDMVGQCLRTVRGIEVNEAKLAVDVIRKVCLEGPGHYLGDNQTLQLMQTEYIYPVVGDRTSPKEWVENNKPDTLEVAIKKKEELLSLASSARFSHDVDAGIRKAFAIHLDLKQMAEYQ